METNAPARMIERLAVLLVIARRITDEIPDAGIYGMDARSHGYLSISTDTHGQEIADLLGLSPDTRMNERHGEKFTWWAGEYEGMTVQLACSR